MRLYITIGILVLLVGLAFAWQPLNAIYFNGVPE